jgi:hypothetical protein
MGKGEGGGKAGKRQREIGTQCVHYEVKRSVEMRAEMFHDGKIY